jgi:hypothetical protein
MIELTPSIRLCCHAHAHLQRMSHKVHGGSIMSAGIHYACIVIANCCTISVTDCGGPRRLILDLSMWVP